MAPVLASALTGRLDFHSLATYLSQNTSSVFLDTISDFHLLLFLVTNEVMPLQVHARVWHPPEYLAQDGSPPVGFADKETPVSHFVSSQTRACVVGKLGQSLGSQIVFLICPTDSM
ncbi:hypothetical protein P7K49_012099 [Saguinus oedipus]|uniref:Uncharacterized protein n=1 Tax=Saguinus oedipus TaxID=9490 RepID=A0ABQ9VSJ4_SAGOE|nr:hypothetical protein P7K49_012099 [Saguinus oedipus]